MYMLSFAKVDFRKIQLILDAIIPKEELTQS